MFKSVGWMTSNVTIAQKCTHTLTLFIEFISQNRSIYEWQFHFFISFSPLSLSRGTHDGFLCVFFQSKTKVDLLRRVRARTQHNFKVIPDGIYEERIWWQREWEKERARMSESKISANPSSFCCCFFLFITPRADHRQRNRAGEWLRVLRIIVVIWLRRSAQSAWFDFFWLNFG